MELTLDRRPWAKFITVKMPDGSSVRVKDEKVVEFLTKKGVKNADKVFDYVWQFYHAKVVTKD